MGYPAALFACHTVRLAVLTDHRLVTSQGHSTDRASIASRGKNESKFRQNFTQSMFALFY